MTLRLVDVGPALDFLKEAVCLRPGATVPSYMILDALLVWQQPTRERPKLFVPVTDILLVLSEAGIRSTCETVPNLHNGHGNKKLKVFHGIELSPRGRKLAELGSRLPIESSGVLYSEAL